MKDLGQGQAGGVETVRQDEGLDEGLAFLDELFCLLVVVAGAITWSLLCYLFV